MLVAASAIEKAWGDRLVLRGVDLVIQPGEVVGLVGPNGCGKSTLLSILAGTEQADHGTVDRRVAAGHLAQEPVLPPGTVTEAARGALAWHAALLANWEAAITRGDEAEVSALQSRLDLVGWDVGHRADAVLSRLRAPPGTQDVRTLSGGERRRVALAQALLASPDLLLLDEPTNHLDAETVEWLEGFLEGFGGGVVLVTHDRYMLERVATRIVEVEDGVALSYAGSYADYLVSRAERQVALQRADDARLEMITREAEWASRSPAAQTKKQKARLDRLAALQALPEMKRQENMAFSLTTGGIKLGRTLVDARGLRKRYGERRVVWDLDLDVGPGERLGVVGPNGAGKSTLLGLLTGKVTPDGGTVHRAPRVKAAVLDQARSGLDDADTIWEAAGGGNDTVVVGDRPVHVAGFLRRFLFPREMLTQKVAGLSGGERARLLLARLMLQGANLILLDEPTNDLDLSTLRVLEEALVDYDGAVIVVTHDRAFLDRVCTGLLAFYGDGRVVRYASRQQWLAALAAASAAPAPVVAPVLAARPASEPRRRLSYRETQALAALPAQIATLETQRAALETRLADPATWKAGHGEGLSRELAELAARIEAAYAQWTELESRQ